MDSYFSHDSNARSDPKILKLRMKHGWAGYGLYWALIEKLRDTGDYTLEADYNILGYDLRCESSIIKSIISDFGLFDFSRDGKFFYSNSLKERMQIVDDKSQKARQKALKRWGTEQDKDNADAEQNKCSSNATAMPQHNNSNSDAMQLNKIKGNKISSSNTDVLLSDTSQCHDAENINYDKLIDFFNSTTKGVFGNIRAPLSKNRKDSIRARIREHGKGAFQEVVRKAYASDFLKGNNGFTATFDWLIKPANFDKVLSGNYDNKHGNKTNQTDTSSIDEELVRNIAEGYARAACQQK